MKIVKITPFGGEYVLTENENGVTWLYSRYLSGEWTEHTGDIEETVLNDYELESLYEKYKPTQLDFFYPK